MSTYNGSSLQASQLTTSLSSNVASLLDEGFDERQAERVLSFHTSRLKQFSIENTRNWLQLLRKLDVKDPVETVSKNVFILKHGAEGAQANADVLVKWGAGLGLTHTQVAESLSERLMLLVIPHANAAAVTTLLSSELGWRRDQIAHVLIKNPRIFGCSPIRSLRPKVAWFKSKGLTTRDISQAIWNTPSLITSSIGRNESQLSALQAMGFSPAEVLQVVRKMPVLLTCNMSGAIVQAKIRFLTQVIGRPVQDALVCPVYFCLSLMERTCPRWMFHSLYCSSQSFVLRTNLVPLDKGFVARLSSPLLDATCAARKLTRLQLFEEFKGFCQQGLGKDWVAEEVGGLIQAYTRMSEGTMMLEAASPQASSDENKPKQRT